MLDKMLKAAPNHQRLLRVGDRLISIGGVFPHDTNDILAAMEGKRVELEFSRLVEP